MTVEELIKNCQVIRSSRRSTGMQIKNGQLIVRTSYRTSNAFINSFINSNRAWLEKQLKKLERTNAGLEGVEPLSEQEIKNLMKLGKKVFPERVAYYAPLIGVTPSGISVRCQKTRWGSCSAKKSLNFNCLLLLAPSEVLDSVVVHELCHIKEMNHSDRFYREVLRVYPDYYKCHKWLKDNGDALMIRAGKRNNI